MTRKTFTQLNSKTAGMAYGGMGTADSDAPSSHGGMVLPGNALACASTRFGSNVSHAQTPNMAGAYGDMTHWAQAGPAPDRTLMPSKTATGETIRKDSEAGSQLQDA